MCTQGTIQVPFTSYFLFCFLGKSLSLAQYWPTGLVLQVGDYKRTTLMCSEDHTQVLLLTTQVFTTRPLPQPYGLFVVGVVIN